MKSLILLLSFVPLHAFAEVSFQQFRWQADKKVEIVFQTATGEKVAKGFLDDDGSTSSVVGDLAVTAHSYTNSFIVIEFAEISSPELRLLILERQNGMYRPLMREIRGTPATLHTDFDTALKLLMKGHKWDSAQAIRSFAEFANQNPGKTVADFRAQVESEQVALAKPKARNSGKTKALPKSQIKVATEQTNTAETKSAQVEEVPAQEPTKPKEKVRRRREPLPYEPRFRGYESNYPGQSMRRRSAPPPWFFN